MKHFRAVDAEIILCEDVVVFLDFHMVISSAACYGFSIVSSLLVIRDPDPMLPLALALNRPPRVSNLSDEPWTNGFS